MTVNRKFAHHLSFVHYNVQRVSKYDQKMPQTHIGTMRKRQLTQTTTRQFE